MKKAVLKISVYTFCNGLLLVLAFYAQLLGKLTFNPSKDWQLLMGAFMPTIIITVIGTYIVYRIFSKISSLSTFLLSVYSFLFYPISIVLSMFLLKWIDTPLNADKKPNDSIGFLILFLLITFGGGFFASIILAAVLTPIKRLITKLRIG